MERQQALKKAPQGSFFLPSTAPVGCPCPTASYLLPQTWGRFLPPPLLGETPGSACLYGQSPTKPYKCHIYMASPYIKLPCMQPSCAEPWCSMLNRGGRPRHGTTVSTSLSSLNNKVFHLSLRSYKRLFITAFKKTLPSSKNPYAFISTHIKRGCAVPHLLTFAMNDYLGGCNIFPGDPLGFRLFWAP